MTSPLGGRWAADDPLAIVKGRCSPQDVNALVSTPDGAVVFGIVKGIAADNLARINRSICARHLIRRPSDDDRTASGAESAITDVYIGRSKASVGKARVLRAGTVVRTNDGHDFALNDDCTFAAGEWAAKTASVTAVVPGYASTSIEGQINAFAAIWNGAEGDKCEVTAADAAGDHLIRRVTSGDYFLTSFLGGYLQLSSVVNPGVYARVMEVSPDGTWVRVRPDKPLLTTSVEAWKGVEIADLGFTVTQPDPTSQGCLDTLDALGGEVGRRRREGEFDDQLAAAIINLPDAVSATAIKRAVDRVLSIFGPCTVYEYGALDGAAEGPSGTSFKRFPGFIADHSACDVAPDETKFVTPGSPMVGGLATIGPKDGNALFYVELPPIVAMLGEVYGFAADTLPVPLATEDPPAASVGTTAVHGFPRSFVADVSPCCDGGAAPGDLALRRAIAQQLRLLKGAGVSWSFLPTVFFTPTP